MKMDSARQQTLLNERPTYISSIESSSAEPYGGCDCKGCLDEQRGKINRPVEAGQQQTDVDAGEDAERQPEPTLGQLRLYCESLEEYLGEAVQTKTSSPMKQSTGLLLGRRLIRWSPAARRAFVEAIVAYKKEKRKTTTTTQRLGSERAENDSRQGSRQTSLVVGEDHSVVPICYGLHEEGEGEGDEDGSGGGSSKEDESGENAEGEHEQEPEDESKSDDETPFGTEHQQADLWSKGLNRIRCMGAASDTGPAARDEADYPPPWTPGVPLPDIGRLAWSCHGALATEERLPPPPQPEPRRIVICGNKYLEVGADAPAALQDYHYQLWLLGEQNAARKERERAAARAVEETIKKNGEVTVLWSSNGEGEIVLGSQGHDTRDVVGGEERAARVEEPHPGLDDSEARRSSLRPMRGQNGRTRPMIEDDGDWELL